VATADVLDLVRLLAPIPGDNPAGCNLREDFSPTSVYHQLKDARNQARTLERRLLTDDDPSAGPKPDWSPLLSRTAELLAVAASLRALCRSCARTEVR
jgi:type VI secretion system protein ImpA